MEEELAELALKCFDGDPEKAVALLKLLKLSLQSDVDVIEERDIPVDSCRWEKTGQCWLNMPDSLRPCTKPCTCFEKII